MTLIRLFPLINMFLIEHVFVCVSARWLVCACVFVCVCAHCCQWGMIIRLLIPLILMLLEWVIVNTMSGWVCMWSFLNSTILLPLTYKHRGGNTRRLHLWRWREYKWDPLQSPNYLQRSQLVVLCIGFAWGNMRGGDITEGLGGAPVPPFSNKYERAYSFVSSRLFLILVCLRPRAKPDHLNRENETMFLPIDFLFSFYNCCHKA